MNLNFFITFLMENYTKNINDPYNEYRKINIIKMSLVPLNDTFRLIKDRIDRERPNLNR